MRKLSKVLLAVLAAVIIYFMLKDILVPIADDILKEIDKNTNTQNEVTSKSFSALKYKAENAISKSDRKILDEVMIALNEELVTNNKFNNSYSDIDGFYDLQPYFLEYKLYLATKYKVKDIMEELPAFLSEVSNFSESDIISYYNNNKKYLDEKFGIETVDELQNFIICLKQLKLSKSVKLHFYSSTIYHNAKNRTISIFGDIEGENNTYTSVNFQFKPYYSTVNQASPYVKIIGSVGGFS